MRRLVRKSSEAGSAADMLISGLGCGAAFLFAPHLSDGKDGNGRAGVSGSSEFSRVP